MGRFWRLPCMKKKAIGLRESGAALLESSMRANLIKNALCGREERNARATVWRSRTWETLTYKTLTLGRGEGGGVRGVAFSITKRCLRTINPWPVIYTWLFRLREVRLLLHWWKHHDRPLMVVSRWRYYVLASAWSNLWPISSVDGSWGSQKVVWMSMMSRVPWLIVSSILVPGLRGFSWE